MSANEPAHIAQQRQLYQAAMQKQNGGQGQGQQGYNQQQYGGYAQQGQGQGQQYYPAPPGQGQVQDQGQQYGGYAQGTPDPYGGTQGSNGVYGGYDQQYQQQQQYGGYANQQQQPYQQQQQPVPATVSIQPLSYNRNSNGAAIAQQAQQQAQQYGGYAQQGQSPVPAPTQVQPRPNATIGSEYPLLVAIDFGKLVFSPCLLTRRHIHRRIDTPVCSRWNID